MSVCLSLLLRLQFSISFDETLHHSLQTKSKIEIVVVKIPTIPSPIFPIFILVMHCQCQCPNTVVTRPVDSIGGGPVPKVGMPHTRRWGRRWRDPSETRSAGAPTGGLGRGSVAPPQYGSLGLCPQTILKKNQR